MVVAGLCRILARRGIPGRTVQNPEHEQQFRRHDRWGDFAPRNAGAGRGAQPSVRVQPRAAEAGRRPNPNWWSGARRSVPSLPPTTSTTENGWPASLPRVDRLRTDYDVVICEGAGSPAEINLRPPDLATEHGFGARGGPARGRRRGYRSWWTAGAPVWNGRRAVAGGDQAMIAGFIVNKFRGIRSCSRRASISWPH